MSRYKELSPLILKISEDIIQASNTHLDVIAIMTTLLDNLIKIIISSGINGMDELLSISDQFARAATEAMIRDISNEDKKDTRH